MNHLLVIGSGGREHAIASELSKSPSVTSVTVCPGNDGMAQELKTISTPIKMNEESLKILKELQITHIVIGPEKELALGYADYFRKKGFTVLGTSKEATQFESSKAYTKKFLLRHNIPTAGVLFFDNAQDLIHHCINTDRTAPWVLKYDGLAAGKGVLVSSHIDEIKNWAHQVWEENIFNDPSQPLVLVEDFLSGHETSVIGLCDGKCFAALPSSQDHKRLLDGQKGPNTGGMGVISPSPLWNQELQEKVDNQIVVPFLNGLQSEGIHYRGALYFGIMINSEGNPFVVEINTRFGDPETQATLPRLNIDFFEWVEATSQGKLSELTNKQETIVLTTQQTVSHLIVGATEGYPISPRIGDPITIPPLDPSQKVYFAGVKKEASGALLTHGGRVLGLYTEDKTLEIAQKKGYETFKKIAWNGLHYRKDIGVSNDTDT